MSAEFTTAARALTERFLRDYPREAARELERIPTADAVQALAEQPVHVLRRLWEHLSPDVADLLLPKLPQALADHLLTELDPARAAAMLGRMTEAQREAVLERLDAAVARELRRMLTYSPDSAGGLMDTQILAMRGELTAGAALERLRQRRPRSARQVYLVDDEARLEAVVDIQDIALAEPDRPLTELARALTVTVSAMDPRDEIVDRLEEHREAELPVVDIQGRLLGAIHAAELMRALQETTTADMQTMVGASREERALSPVSFAVKKRLLWMQINLATAFLAASVVGLFESTIAQFTALAVLLPVVAGQSGNAGAQALAVTMRGLALREIGVRHWFRVAFKEVRVGALNGIAVAATTALGVYLWSQSWGLALIITIAMVFSMTMAGIAGALVPIMLTRFGQDPAQSSSIVLTTVTDVAGFMSFLGIATLLSGLLVA